jgi:hypothetical protein
MAELVGQIPEAGKAIQWTIEDPDRWTPEEIETVVAPIRKHMQWLYTEYGMIGNNYWMLYKMVGSPNLFQARKRTWEYGSCHGTTAEECAESIKEYFGKN